MVYSGESVEGVLQRTLARWRSAIQPFVRRYRLPQSPRRALEAGLDDVMAVVAIHILDVQADAGILRQRLKPFLEQLGVHLAQLRLGDGHLPDQIGPVGQVQRHTSQSLIHRNDGGAETGYAGKIAQRLLDRLADDDGGVFGGVVVVHMQVARGPHLEVDHGMARKAAQHVIEEADAGVDIGLAGTVQIEGDRNIGLAGFSLNSGGTQGGGFLQ